MGRTAPPAAFLANGPGARFQINPRFVKRLVASRSSAEN
jgi:hypothetical protein